jgi:glycerol-3-phosphate acyltransferase PlsY
LSVGAAYFLGSIPWPYLVVRVLRGIDIRSVGDGNMGTQNVWQAVGPAAALVVLLGDMAKGAAAVLLPGLIGAPAGTAALAGPAAVVGHIWPVFLRFRGGGGAATALGVLWALLPREMALLFAVGALAPRASSPRPRRTWPHPERGRWCSRP